MGEMEKPLNKRTVFAALAMHMLCRLRQNALQKNKTGSALKAAF